MCTGRCCLTSTPAQTPGCPWPINSLSDVDQWVVQVPAHLDVAATQAELRAGLPDIGTAAEALSRAADAAPADPGDSSKTAGAAADGALAAAHGRAAEPLRPDPDPNPAESMPACVARAGREELEVVFLGTGASIPSKYRNVTGIYLHRFAAARPPAKPVTKLKNHEPMAQISSAHTRPTPRCFMAECP